jgi:hypothetical protein
MEPRSRRKRQDWFNLQFSVRLTDFPKLSFTHKKAKKGQLLKEATLFQKLGQNFYYNPSNNTLSKCQPIVFKIIHILLLK